MKKLILILLMLGLAPTVVFGQARTHITTSSSLPPSCTVGDLYYSTQTTGGGAGLYSCTAVNVWSKIHLTGFTALFGDGTGAQPSIAFTSEPALGFYRKNPTNIGAAGHLVPGFDNYYDFGGVTQNWRNGAFGGVVGALEYAIGYNGTNFARVQDVRLRGEYQTNGQTYGAGMMGIVNGSDLALGHLRYNRTVAGLDGDPSDGATADWQHQFRTNTYVPGAIQYSLAANVVSILDGITPTADVLKDIHSGYFEIDLGGTHNYTGNEYTAVYAGAYLHWNPTPTGNITKDFAAVVGDMEYSTNGTIARAFSFMGYCCSYDPFSGTLGVAARTGFFHATQPFGGATPPARHTAIWVEDQTAGGSFTSPINEVMHVDTTSGTEDFSIAANGDVTAANLRLSTGRARPACTVTNRGQFYATQGAAGVADTVAVCAKSNTDTYAWRTIF